MTGGSLATLVFSGALALLVGFGVLHLLDRRPSVAERIADYVTPAPASIDDRRTLIERALGDQARPITRSPFIARLRIEMEVADLSVGAEQLIAMTLVVAVLVGWLLSTTTHSPLAALLALLVPFAAKSVVQMLADRQRRRFSEQLPDNLQVISSAMRAGQTFVGAMRAVLDDAPEPSRRELRRAVMDEQLGIPLPEALGHVTERMKSEDFHHIAIVASLQRETGGNTAEVIDLVADTVRDRIELRRMVRGLTAQGRLSGGVLSLLPVGLLMMISLINPSYVHPLFHTTEGVIALCVGIGLILCGGYVIKRIVEIKV